MTVAANQRGRAVDHWQEFCLLFRRLGFGEEHAGK